MRGHRIIAAAGVIALAFTAIAVLRVGQNTAEARQVVFHKQRVYALGSLPAFSVWLHDWMNEPSGQRGSPGLGTATVAEVDVLTGRSRSATRAYDDFAIIDQAGTYTTVIRPLGV